MELNGFFTNTADGVCAVTSAGRIVIWNRAAEKLLGYTAREVIGKACCEVFVGRDEAGNRLCYQGCHVMALVKQGELVQSFDLATRTKAGKPAWLNTSVVVVPGARPDLSTTVHFFRDVTASHEIEGLVRERLAQAGSGSTNGSGNGTDPASELTRREMEVLRLIGVGANTKTVADRLHVSPATVRNHVQNIFSKLGVHSRLEAVAHATRGGLL